MSSLTNRSAHISAKKHAVNHRAVNASLMTSLLSSAFMLATGSARADQPTEKASLQLAMADVIEVIGYNTPTYKADKASSSKFTQPLLDTPQTLVVVKKELFEQQAATTLSETLRNTPGITMLMGENGNTATGDSIFMRGFDTQGSIFVDGIRDLGSISRDTFNTEQVEIAKGPAGVDNGRGAASGYVNLSSKTAGLQDDASANITLGTADYKRSTLDVNRTLSDSAALRVNLMVQDSGVDGRDVVENKSTGIATSLAFGLGSDTRTTFNFLHTEQRNLPDGGVPTAGLRGYYSSAYAAAFPNGNGPSIATVDNTNFYGALNDHNDVDVNMATLRIEQDLAHGIVLRNSTRFGRATQDLELTGVNTLVIPSATKTNLSTWQVARQRQGRDQTNQIFTNQTNLTMSFETFGLKNELSGGVEFIQESQTLKTLGLPWVSATSTSRVTQANANLYNPSTSDEFQPLIWDGAKIDGETTTSALYALDTITLNEHWEISAGLRTEHYNTHTDQIVRQSTATSSTQTVPVGTLLGREANDSDNLISWKLGGVYKPTAKGSIYVSYATSQLPPGSANFTSQGAFALNTDTSTITANNANFDPQKGTNQEIGTKWDVFNNKLALTAAVFRSSNTNEIVTNPDTTVTPVGERQVQGLELGMAGIVMQNWQISAGMAFMDPKIKSGSTGSGASLASLNGGAIQWSPKRTFTLWNSYAFSNGFTLAGGARYMDSLVTSSIVDPTKLAQRSMVSVPDYWVFDAMMSYTINPNINLQLNLINLADEDYLASVNNSGTRYYPGAPRSARLGMTIKF